MDGSGCVSLDEFGKGLASLAIEASEKEVMGVFNDHDWTHDGRLHMQEFRDFLLGKKSRLEDAPLADDIGVFETSANEDGSKVDGTKKARGVARRGTTLACEDIEDF